MVDDQVIQPNSVIAKTGADGSMRARVDGTNYSDPTDQQFIDAIGYHGAGDTDNYVYFSGTADGSYAITYGLETPLEPTETTDAVFYLDAWERDNKTVTMKVYEGATLLDSVSTGPNERQTVSVTIPFATYDALDKSTLRVRFETTLLGPDSEPTIYSMHAEVPGAQIPAPATGPGNIDVAGNEITLFAASGHIATGPARITIGIPDNTIEADGSAEVSLSGKAFTESGEINPVFDSGIGDDDADNCEDCLAVLDDTLTSNNRTLLFRYELLDKNDNHLRWLPNVEGGSVEYNGFRSIKRTARFSIVEDKNISINYLTNRIRPWIWLAMPDGIHYKKYPLGIFLLSTPARKFDGNRGHRDVEGYDKTVILNDDKVSSRYVISAGTNYVTAIRTLLEESNVGQHKIKMTDLTLPSDRDWDPGTSKLTIINALLGSINYRSLWFDAEGTAIGEKYVRPDNKPVLYRYDDSTTSVLYPDVMVDFDLFNVANQWTKVVSQPDETELVSSYTNTNPDSPTSTVSRGRVITDFRMSQDETPPTQAVLDEQVERLAFAASQVYEHTEFQTAIMPFHENFETVHLSYPKMNIEDTYAETGWSIDLKAGGVMKHFVRRVITI